MIELQSVARRYVEGANRRSVFEDLELVIETGTKLGVLGRSGSGKTTLLNLIAGIDTPDSGRVLIDGVDLASMDETERTLFRRRRVGFVFQFFNLVPTLTVLENVRLPLELDGRTGREDRERAAGLLEAVGLGDRAASFPDRLSGGEQQRVAIARALAGEPAVILADEPTGNLDLETGRKVLDLLLGLVDEKDRTLVLVTHAAEVAARCDRVLAVREGHVVERDARGTPLP